ncbi:MAG TPA: winged helix-turn-helix domain-containing protein [Bryobacteraceae bacterium]|nr:winged helix-turn-helix domain-containing protein [Bryobacteraceae bacterium]
MQEVPRASPAFHFGDFEADLSSGELRKQGSRLKIQEQPFQILIVLLDHAGQVVSREELCKRLWSGGTFVDFEQGLATAVKKLRHALGDDAEMPRYVETIPKRGYRFIASVERSESPFPVPAPVSQRLHEAPPVGAPASPGTRARSRRVNMLVITVGLALALMLALRFNGLFPTKEQSSSGRGKDVRQAAESVSERPLTTLSGGEYEPALSPDGKMMAFVWGQEGGHDFHIYTQSIDLGSPTRLTTGAAPEGSPAWSPDGRYLAYVTCTEQPDQSGLYIIPVRGGAERKVANVAPRAYIFDRQIDWSPDGNSLALVDRNSAQEPYSIYVLSLNNGARRQLSVPPPASPGDSGPVFSPNGRQIAFRRTESIGNTDLYLASPSGGNLRRLTFDRRFTSGHAWTQDGRDIVFTSKRSGPLSLWRIDASGGVPLAMPGVTEGAYNLAIARTGHRLIYSKYISDSNIWETNRQSSEARRILGSTRNERSPQYSPDGSRIAFRSDRTGEDEIWVSDASGENDVRLTSFDGPLTGTPRWSPDGQFVVFDSRPNGNPDIYVVSANGGPPRRVTSSTSEDVVPSWSADGRWIYFASNRSGSWQVWKIASQTVEENTRPIQLTRQGGFSAFGSPDGRTVFYSKGRDLPGIWSVAANGGSERLVTGLLKAGYWGNWGVARAGLFFVRPVPPDAAEVDTYEFRSGRVRRAALLKKDPPFSDSGFAVSSDGRRMLYTQVESSSSEIILVENFR